VTDLNLCFERYCALLEMAEKDFRGGALEAAAALAQIAARYAYPSNAGLFASPRLERLLVSIGASIPLGPGDARTRNRRTQPRRVLHVLSYARPVGGDTRFVWRWIQEEKAIVHDVVVTSQADISDMYEVPQELGTSVTDSGGKLYFLQAPTSRPLVQALELRQLCQQADIVVLHLFPYDIVPILALSSGCDEAKTIYLNHSDHTFWIGASVAHLIVHLRRQSRDFLSRRRQLVPDRDEILPIPLSYSSRTLSRADAKRALGYSNDDILLLTIASPFKYSTPARQDFLETVVPVLRELPNATLVAVGPAPEGAWNFANSDLDGRVIALGTRTDTALLYAAADVYLDPIPFSSVTSLLEAGCFELPLLGHISGESDMWLLGPGAPGLENAMEIATNTESYQSLLRRLVLDDGYRLASGKRTRAQILDLHTGEKWRAATEAIYERLHGMKDRGCLSSGPDLFNEGPLNVALAHLYDQVKSPNFMRQIMWGALRGLPYRVRARTVLEMYKKGFDLSFLNLLPTSINLLGRALVTLARRRTAMPRRPMQVQWLGSRHRSGRGSQGA
jgi:hypothetical protein